MIYLDTSAAVPLFVREAASDAVDAWLESCADTIISSAWIVTELASALSMKVRRGEINTRQAQAAWKDFDGFCKSGLRLLPVSRKAFSEAATMARDSRSGLRSGDSLHLAIALEAGVSGFSTADDLLAKTAKAKGLKVIRF
jgi:predicted nucleic acid-binding protein